MKLKPSIFAIISALPCITFFVGDSFADTCDGKGWYRWEQTSTSKDWCMPCPAGCYCDGNAEKAKIFTGGDKWRKCAKNLDSYGIYYCGNGWTSDSTSEMCTGLGKQSYCRGPQSSRDCYFTASDTKAKIYKGSTDIKCAAGTYIKAGYANCQPCKTGYICPGGTFQISYTEIGRHFDQEPDPGSTWSSNWKVFPKNLYRSPTTDNGIFLCPSGTVANSNHTACVKKDSSSSSSSNSGSKITCKAGQYLPANASSCSPCKDRYYCLGGEFTKSSSDQGLRTCVFSQPNKNKTACEVRCLTGKYLPANSYSCQTCKDRYYCRGGWFSQHTSYDQGALFCSGTVNETKSMCIRNGGSSNGSGNGDSSGGSSSSQSQQRVSCGSGQYLPANASDSSQCQPCKDRYYCLGGSFPVASYDQGLRTCPYNAAPNASRTKCEYGVYQCEAGTYMPAKGSKCITCPSTKNYCPGGNFKPSDYDQGKKVCPGNTVANSKRSACLLTLTKDQMQYGMSGKDKSQIALDEQCWTRTDMNDYAYCMFGGKINVIIQERYYK